MNIAVLEQLCKTPGVSGREEAVRSFIAENMVFDSMQTDAAGNLICVKKSSLPGAPAVALDAHMDSVGLCVKECLPDGFLKFSPVGGIDERILPAAPVVVCGKRPVFGVVATKPPHLLEPEERKKPLRIEQMMIDTGNNADGIAPGDRILFQPAFRKMCRSVSGTYLDNRAGCAAILELFDRLKDTPLPFDLKAVFTVGEESGLMGAKNSDFSADLVLVLDVTFGKTPDETSDQAMVCGKGAAIGIGPNVHKKISKALEQCAEKHNIPHQTEVLEGSSGTNAWSYQVRRLGIPCGMLSFPIKYMHTPAETMRIADYDSVLALTEAYLLSLTPENIKEIAGDTLC